jgi:hypothetical protein
VKAGQQDLQPPFPTASGSLSFYGINCVETNSQ